MTKNPQQSPIHLHIERLVVHGMTPARRHQIGPAIEAELRRLITEHGLPSHLAESGTSLHLPGGSFHMAPGTTAEDIGTQIAGALHGGAPSAQRNPSSPKAGLAHPPRPRAISARQLAQSQHPAPKQPIPAADLRGTFQGKKQS